MKTMCQNSPSDKKKYISEIGKILVVNNGKQQYYKPQQIKKAHKQSSFVNTFDFSCWAMAVFSPHSDFDNYHNEIGETCDYVEMKTEMLEGLSVSTNSDWTNIADLDIDSSWLDFGDSFEAFFEGIGEFIGGILEGFN